MISQKPFIPMHVAADTLGVPTEAVFHWMSRGILPGRQTMAGKRLVEREAVESLAAAIREGLVEPTWIG